MKGNAEIVDILFRLGATPNYNGFFQTVLAVRLARHDPSRLNCVTKSIYQEVARSYGTSGDAVERNIRTIVSIGWNCNRPLLEELARRPLADKPKASQFLALLTAYCLAETLSH